MKWRQNPEASKHPGAERRAAFYIPQNFIAKKQESPIAFRALGTAEHFQSRLTERERRASADDEVHVDSPTASNCVPKPRLRRVFLDTPRLSTTVTKQVTVLTPRLS